MRIAVIGGGLVGLATAYHLVKHHDVVVLEKEEGIAKHQSGRNSGVIHSGIYYPEGSQKAANCIRGRQMLLQFCAEYRVPFQITGKIIVAMDDDERARIHTLLARGAAHGLRCRLMSRAEFNEIEPAVAGLEAVFVPEAGVVDFKAVAVRLADLIGELGGEIRLGTKVVGLVDDGAQVVVETDRGVLRTDMVVNAAGLYSDKVAEMAKVERSVKIVPFRGEYYYVREPFRNLCNTLVYPAPDPRVPFLGVHVSRGIDGSVSCGPNAVLALSREGYGWSSINIRETIDVVTDSGFQRLLKRHARVAVSEVVRSLSKRIFLRSVQRLIPEMKLEYLEEGKAGVRAQAVWANGQLCDDFLIHREPKFVHVLNAPSPAATSCLSIGKSIADAVMG